MLKEPQIWCRVLEWNSDFVLWFTRDFVAHFWADFIPRWVCRQFSSQNSTSLSHWRRKWLKSRGRPFQLFSPSKYDKSKKEHLQLLSQISYLHLLLTRCWGYFTCQEDAAHNKSIRMCWVFSPPVSQSHGHSHYPGADHYSTPDRDLEEGEKEKLQQNGEASSLALGKVDAGEGELMLSPAQTPQVWM